MINILRYNKSHKNANGEYVVSYTGKQLYLRKMLRVYKVYRMRYVVYYILA